LSGNQNGEAPPSGEADVLVGDFDNAASLSVEQIQSWTLHGEGAGDIQRTRERPRAPNQEISEEQELEEHEVIFDDSTAK
jgi:hypothetical protein